MKAGFQPRWGPRLAGRAEKKRCGEGLVGRTIGKTQTKVERARREQGSDAQAQSGGCRQGLPNNAAVH